MISARPTRDKMCVGLGDMCIWEGKKLADIPQADRVATPRDKLSSVYA